MEGNKEAVRLVPLGGLEEIGRNCSFLEYKNEIVIIDVGLQFPEEETPGIDYIIPNVQYLEKKKENIHGIILTHGHYDHIGGLPHVLAKLGNPPIYATSITKAIIEKRQEDFPNSPKLNVVTVKNNMTVRISNNFEAYFFGVPHTIPETTGVLMKTPVGNVCHFADFRVDYNDEGEPQGLEEFEKVGAMGVHTFTMKLWAFAIGASTAGAAGVINASRVNFVSPSSFMIIISVLVLCMVILGGMGSMVGPIVGAAAIVIIPEALRNYVPAGVRFMVFGAILVVMMIFRPQGLFPSKRIAQEQHGVGVADEEKAGA